METNAIAENNINWTQEAETAALEILVKTTKQKENLAKQVFIKLKNGFEFIWRVFWALWAMPTIRIQKAPGEYVTHTEEYQNIQNHLRPY